MWRLADVTWLMVPSYSVAAPSQSDSFEQQSARTKFDAKSVTRLNLFGLPPKRETSPAADDRPDPTPTTRDTKLKLVLSGIVLSSNPAFSRAMIQKGGRQELYAVSDDIDDNTTLHEINEGHVVINNRGELEVLRMEKLAIAKASGNGGGSSFTGRSNLSAANSTQISSETAKELSGVRDQLLRDPTKASDFIRVRPVYSKGVLTGYRIYPGKNRQLFKQAGLRSGDLVKAINGQTLDDPQKGFQMLSSLSSAMSITIDLQRRGKAESVSVNLQ
ncbi:MAG: general secretion pathway protein C [Gammaproteobacteria bacterium]|jgi:general secretion pathway protein C